MPVQTAEFAAVGVTAMLEAIRAVDPTIRFYQASSSEIFGEPDTMPQTERTPLAPLTPYGVAKAYGHFITGSTADAMGFTHPREFSTTTSRLIGPLDFVTRKISAGAAAISLQLGASPGSRESRWPAGLELCRGRSAGDVVDAAAGRGG